MSGSSRFGTALDRPYTDFDSTAPRDDQDAPVRYSDIFRISEEETSLVVIINEFDDVNVEVMPQGSIDGTWWVDLLSSPAQFDYNDIGTMVNKSHGALAVTDPWPFIRVKVTTADDLYDPNNYPVSPLGGQVLVQWSSKRSRQNII